METKWTKSQIIQFLNIYKKYDCLWDALSHDYVDRDARDVAFTRMLEELNAAGVNVVSREYLKKKIKSIRDTYRNEVNRIKKSKKSGARSEDIYKPKLAWFSTANSFWHFYEKESSSNLDLDAQSSSSQDDAKIEEEETQVSIESYDVEAQRRTSLRERHHRRKQMKVAWSSKSQALKRSARRMPSLTHSPAKIAKISQSQNSPDRLESAVDKLTDILQFDSEDQYDKFAKHIAAQLRELPLRRFVLLQDKIQGLITTERLSCIEPEMSDYSVSTFILKDELQ